MGVARGELGEEVVAGEVGGDAQGQAALPRERAVDGGGLSYNFV